MVLEDIQNWLSWFPNKTGLALISNQIRGHPRACCNEDLSQDSLWGSDLLKLECCSYLLRREEGKCWSHIHIFKYCISHILTYSEKGRLSELVRNLHLPKHDTGSHQPVEWDHIWWYDLGTHLGSPSLFLNVALQRHKVAEQPLILICLWKGTSRSRIVWGCILQPILRLASRGIFTYPWRCGSPSSRCMLSVSADQDKFRAWGILRWIDSNDGWGTQKLSWGTGGVMHACSCRGWTRPLQSQSWKTY